MVSSSNPSAAIKVLIPIESQVYVPEPPMEEEKALIWKSRVFIPFSISEKTHAFFGPLLDSTLDIKKVRKVFHF